MTGLPAPRSRYLFPYERRLVAWKVRRLRRRRYDVDEAERDYGPEYVRLFAAYLVGQQLLRAIGILGIVVMVIFGDMYGWSGYLAGQGVTGVGAVASVVGLIRMEQGYKASKEYQQIRPLAPQWAPVLTCGVLAGARRDAGATIGRRGRR